MFKTNFSGHNNICGTEKIWGCCLPWLQAWAREGEH